MKTTLNAVADLDRHLRQSRKFTLLMLAIVMACGLGAWMVLWRGVLPGFLDEGILFDATVILMSIGIAWVISFTWRKVWEQEERVMAPAEFKHFLHDVDRFPDLAEQVCDAYELQGKRLLTSQCAALSNEIYRRKMDRENREAEAYVESLLGSRLRTQEAQ